MESRDPLPATTIILDDAQLSAHLRRKHQTILDLHHQLAFARAEFRREKAEERQKLQQEAEALASDRREVPLLRSQLQTMRERYLRSWKQRSRNLREKVAERQKQLDTLQSDLEAQRLELAMGRQQLIHDQEIFREQSESLRRELSAREMVLTQQGSELLRREQALIQNLRGGPQTEQRLKILQEESVGLETRIAHQRKLLEEQDRRKATTFAPVALTGPSSAVAMLMATPDSSLQNSGPVRHEILEKMIDDLSDQRASLGEMLAMFTVLRDEWTTEQEQYLRELESIVEEVRQREQTNLETEDLLDEERRQIRVERSQLEALRAKISLVQNAGTAEKEKQNLLLEERQKGLRLRQQQLAEVAFAWMDQRQTELAEVRSQQNRTAELIRRFGDAASRHAGEILGFNDRELRLLERERGIEELHAQVFGAENPLLAEKKLERIEKQMRNSLAGSIRRLEELRDEIQTGVTDLEEVFRVTSLRILESLEADPVVAPSLEFPELLPMTNLHAVCDQQIQQLQKEVEHLAGLIDPRLNDLPPQRRAA